jgi:hypothetical protein
MALLSVLMAVIVFPGLAVVGLHHDMRHWVIGLASRVASLLVSAVLYAAAAGIDARATILLLATNAVPRQIAVLLLALLPVGLWVLLRRIRNKPAIPRPLAMGIGLLGMRHWLRGGAHAGAEAGAEEALSAPPASTWSYRHGGIHTTYIFVGGPGGWPGPGAAGGWVPPAGSLPASPADPGGDSGDGDGGGSSGGGPSFFGAGGPFPFGGGGGPFPFGGGPFPGSAGGGGPFVPPDPAPDGLDSGVDPSGRPVITLRPDPDNPDTFMPWDGGDDPNGAA